MGVNLEKGQRVSLSKGSSTLTKVSVGLGWDERTTDGSDFDLDASVFMLQGNGRVRNDTDFVFYNNDKGADGAVYHTGDNLTGGGDGDDETIEVDLQALRANAPDIEKLAFVVTIHEAEQKSQNFGQVENAFIRIVDMSSNEEIVRYDLTEDYSIETAMVFGELYFKDSEWRFVAVGSGFEGNLTAACKTYGINVG
jgi:tellurium resistance protein TerD